MVDERELRLEFCRIFAHQQIGELDILRRAEACVQYIMNGPKKPEKPDEKQPLKAVS